MNNTTKEVINEIQKYYSNNDINNIIKLLKNEDIKIVLIRESSEEEFDTLLCLDEKLNGLIIDNLFDEKGRNILELFYSAEDRVDSIFNHPIIAKKLMNQEWFCRIISIKNIANNKINVEEHKFFFDYISKNKKRFKSAMLNKKLSNESKDYLLRNIDLDKILGLLPLLDLEVLQPLFNRINFDLCNFTINQIIEILNKGVIIPFHLINKDSFINKICTCKDILQIRFLFNLLSKSYDITFLENKRKEFYLEELNTLNNEENDMTKVFKEIYDEIISSKEDLCSNDIYIIVQNKFVNCSNNLIHKITSNIYSGYKNNSLLESIKKLDNEYSSNIVLDYLFEEFYYNIFIDLFELLTFNKENNVLSEEKYELYNRIAHIDLLNHSEKMSLFKYILNKYKMTDEFYDDMLFARNKMNELVIDSLTTREELKSKRNKLLSAIYGVDVYTYNGKDFFGVVKSGEKLKEHEGPHGYSYSLIGRNAIGTFLDPSETPAFVYDGLRKEQIVHIFPYDSYTRYNRDDISTDYVRVLTKPNDLLDETGSYNEILILEKGNSPSEMDEFFPRLKKIALYCYDKIRRKDIKLAKENNVGIILVNTYKYEKPLNDSVRGLFNEDYMYYLGDNSYDSMIESLDHQREELSQKLF